MAGVWVLVATLVAAAAVGALLKARNGRVRAAKPGTTLPAPVTAALDPASAVTLVQISTTFCAPCRHAKAVLGQLADRTEGLHHVELDVTDQPEVAQSLSVLRTPTTLALTPDGRELLRVGGVPKGAELLDALRPHLTTRTS
jgi:thiol-disulfide isomerase/thioredoxin